jgi:hypothetical protein
LDSQFLKDGKLEYRQLLSSILLIIPAFTTIIILLYNSNNIADAIIQNPDQQVTMYQGHSSGNGVTSTGASST